MQEENIEELRNSLNSIPEVLITKMRAAIEAVDTEHLHGIIDLATELETEAAEILHNLVDQFEFDLLEEILNE